MEARSTRIAEPFLAWPGIASLRLTLPLSYLFFKIFFSVYGGTSLLAGLRAPRPVFHFGWELHLPFVPSVALLYLSVPLMLALTPFILRTWRTLTPFFLTLTAETLVAGAFFLLVPVAQSYPERVASGFFGGVFRLADRLNLDHNEFPSLQIAFAVTAAMVFGRRCGWLGRAMFALWAAGVGVSTLLMHEHHLLDIAGGAMLGLAAVATVQRRTSDDSFLEGLRIDALCLRELVRLARRRPRSLLAAAALLRDSFPRWRETRVLRAAWCLAQHVAGVPDGDRPAPDGDPETYVRSVLRGLKDEGPFGDRRIAPLAAYVSAELRRFETVGHP
ncbi:MAG TPA: phosphatase PAP2 family protein [Thermoanaerobaculia bacterium]|jgi:membrane-associated phospholipid phosphatase